MLHIEHPLPNDHLLPGTSIPYTSMRVVPPNPDLIQCIHKHLGACLAQTSFQTKDIEFLMDQAFGCKPRSRWSYVLGQLLRDFPLTQPINPATFQAELVRHQAEPTSHNMIYTMFRRMRFMHVMKCPTSLLVIAQPGKGWSIHFTRRVYEKTMCFSQACLDPKKRRFLGHHTHLLKKSMSVFIRRLVTRRLSFSKNMVSIANVLTIGQRTLDVTLSLEVEPMYFVMLRGNLSTDDIDAFMSWNMKLIDDYLVSVNMPMLFYNNWNNASTPWLGKVLQGVPDAWYRCVPDKYKRGLDLVF